MHGAGILIVAQRPTQLRSARHRPAAPSTVTPAHSLVFGECAFPPVSLGPAGDCPCKD